MLSQFRIQAAGVLAVLCLTGLGAMRLDAARQFERRIAIYNIHNSEKLDIVYKRAGKFIPSAMKKINWVMRDWRQDTPTKMDPKLIDIMWEIHTELGSRQPIHLISGYRSPKTNAMLRKTRGGQAKKSRHMLGKAADIHFPDVSVKRMRYSALIRQRGGVGYYPTSALPFVHVDTGRVRHWPRLPRYELALLFPKGHTLHRPKRGGRITKRDVRIARSRHKKLAYQVAAFFDARGQPAAPRPTRVASATREQLRTAAPPQPRRQPQPTIRAGWQPTIKSNPAPTRVAALAPAARPAPKLVSNPRLAERPSTFQPGPSKNDRKRLTDLFTLASLMPASSWMFGRDSETETSSDVPSTATITPPRPNRVTKPPLTLAALLPDANKLTGPEPTHARGAPVTQSNTESNTLHPVDRFGWATGWVTAPAYDEEHPEELYYRPFPLAPLLTNSSSSDDPILASMQHPDIIGTLDFLSDDLDALPMKLRPGKQFAAMLWAHQFTGKAINFGAATSDGNTPAQKRAIPAGLKSRSIRTSMR